MTRWRALLGRGEGALADLLVDHALELRARPALGRSWAALAGLPTGEVLASPFGARMIALGLEAGATTVQHELRPLVPWHAHMRPRQSTRDPLHGRWHRGALRTGKYEEFCQEDAFCAYHPEHGSKWAPHEMLHRAVGFHAPAAASGFARYLAARLNELLPVATWYGLEHALRLDRDGPFDRARDGQDLAAPLERARWLHDDERTLRRRAKAAAPLVRWTLERTAAELAAIDVELASGTIAPSRDAGVETFAGVRLDASSDALAYVEAHGRRLSHPSVAAVHLTLARSHVPSLEQLRARIDRVLDRLLFATLAPRAAEVRRRVAQSAVRDLLARAALAAPGAELHARWLARARRIVGDVTLEPAAVRRFARGLERALGPMLGMRRAHEVCTLGLPAPFEEPDTRCLARGVRAVVPRTASCLGPRGRDELVACLVAGDPARGHLAERVAQALASSDPALGELARLERLLDRGAVEDPRTRIGTPLRHASDDAWVALHAGARVVQFEHDVLALHRGEAVARRPTWVLSLPLAHEHVLCALPPQVAEALSRAATVRLAALRAEIGAAVVSDLAALGALAILEPR